MRPDAGTRTPDEAHWAAAVCGNTGCDTVLDPAAEAAVPSMQGFRGQRSFKVQTGLTGERPVEQLVTARGTDWSGREV